MSLLATTIYSNIILVTLFQLKIYIKIFNTKFSIGKFAFVRNTGFRIESLYKILEI